MSGVGGVTACERYGVCPGARMSGVGGVIACERCGVCPGVGGVTACERCGACPCAVLRVGGMAACEGCRACVHVHVCQVWVERVCQGCTNA